MNSPFSCIDLRLNDISSIEELADITFGLIVALEDSFGLNKDWQQAAPKGVQGDVQGLSPLHINTQLDLVHYFKERGWEDRFLGTPKKSTGSFYNETVIVQFAPKEFSIQFEHIAPDEPGGWRILIYARDQILDKMLFLRCAKAIHKQNERRCGLIHCSYKRDQEQIGKYIPAPLVEEIFVYRIGPKELL